MQIHFGTDGIRGRANETLTVDMAYRIGQYLGSKFSGKKIIIGKDTRLSGAMFESALTSGITSRGANVYQLGICPTPQLIYLTRTKDFILGIMITASHNPYTDNGIKIIDETGKKISATLEKEIEDYMYGDANNDYAISDQIGSVNDYGMLGQFEYANYLKKEFPIDLSKLTICIDCANGSATVTAEKILTECGGVVNVLGNKPNGLNINKDCGSTHIENLVSQMKTGKYDVGFAFDGDADRLIAVCKDGQIVDGDKIIFAIGKYFHDKKILTGNKVVATVMSNLGLFKVLDKYGIGYEKTNVGDKYVYACMQENGYVIGGEQSGHIIISKHATTGDGLLTALQLLTIMVEEGKTLNELTDELVIYPQLLVNVPVNDKQAILEDEEVKNACQQVENDLQGNGRVLVRPSGTEPLVRVMVEAQSQEICEKYCQKIVDLINSKNK